FTPSVVEEPARRLSTSNSQDAALWAAIKGSDKAADFEFYLRRFPKGLYSAVAELIVKQLKEKKVTVETRAEPKDESKTTNNVECKRFFPTIGKTLTVACVETRAELKVKQLKEKKVAVGVYPGKPMAIGEGLPKKPGPARTVKMFNLFCLSLVPEISKIEEAAVVRHFTELKGKALKEYQPLFRAKEMRAWSYEDFGSQFVLTTTRSEPAARFKEEVPEFADSRNFGCSLIFRTNDPKEKVLKEMVDSLGRDPEEVWTQRPRRVHAWTG
ncbi:unnamed protein product, partial [marine sediment metagenome]